MPPPRGATVLDENDRDHTFSSPMSPSFSSFDSSKILVGPMPPDLFLFEFFPNRHPEDDMPSPHHAFDKVPVDAEKESHLYQSIADALNTSSEGGVKRCPGITFFYTGDKDEKPENEDEQQENEGTAKPNTKFDIIGYANQDPIIQDFPNMRSGRKDSIPSPTRTAYPASPGDNLEFTRCRGPNSKDLTRLAREELLSTANEIFSRQLRTFLFTLLMTPNEARFFRWDHAGVVMSAAFDYRKEPGILCRFLWQFRNASSAQCGRDSVKWASDKEDALLRDAIRQHVKSQLGDDFKGIDDEYVLYCGSGRVVKLPVRNITSNGVVEERFFLATRPVSGSSAIASSGTKGFWAMDIETKEIVFLKDTWRTNREDMEVEGDILRSIEGVPNVPTLVCYGDVGDTSNFDHVISRVTKEAGYPLSHLAGSGELTGNIILFADTTSRTRGILIDWELSRKVEEADKRRHWRTGTFAFKSIEALDSNPGPHALVHDAESHVYVVFYCAISYLK
ncbi:hypothetical protein BDN70DRAFT_917372 [Pholiota conissans]|uniref:Fungal-type protein kinase domain-containing protein n=1 Tax=Pholiota conissans TaxID=109636 RepID=A0A9P6D6B8_9AGAR|nr:hypothetical protein BDN70DRAFT_917372 [Pholiota conissans]